MKNKVAPFKRILAFCLSLVLALTPVLTGAVSAADGDDATPAIVNPPSFIYDKDGNYLPDATEIPEGGVKLTKTAKPVDGDPYSFDITLEVEARGITAPAPNANIVLVLDESSSMDEDTLTCTKTEHRHNRNCLTCGKEAHHHEGWVLFGGCYSWDGSLVCQKEEHTHTEACYCGTPEHRHDSSCYQRRANVARTAAKHMVQTFLDQGLAANFGVVGFGTLAHTYLGLTALSAENKSSIDKAIEDATRIGYSEGTNMEQGIVTATNMLADKTGEQNFIVVISDGVPTFYGTRPDGDGSSMDSATKAATVKAAEDARAKNITLYGIAFDSDIAVMKEIFGADKYSTTASGAALDSLLSTIASQIITAVKGAVSDTMGDHIDHDSVDVEGATVSNGVLNWNPGTIDEKKSITYRITLGDSYAGGLVDANKQAILSYNGDKKAAFPIPQVSAPIYHVSYQWAAGSQTPGEVLLPVDSANYRIGDAFAATPATYDPVYTTDAYGNRNGVYTFEGWDIVSGTIDDHDIVITGSWKYESLNVEAHKVIYNWGTPDAAVTAVYTLPVDTNDYVKGQAYPVDATVYNPVEVRNEQGVLTGAYVFSGWNAPNDHIMGDEDVVITGEWTFVPVDQISYIVNYYVDSVSDANFLGTDPDVQPVLPGTDVANRVNKNLFKPADTDRLHYGDGQIVSSTVITEAGQVINVVYNATPVEPKMVGYTVVHEYFLSEDGQPFAKAGEAREQFTAELGQTILASSLRQQPTYNNKTYTYQSAAPESITLSEEDGNYVFTLRYERTEEPLPPTIVGYTIVHEYYFSDAGAPFVKVGEVREFMEAELGARIMAVEIDKKPDYEGNTYTYRSAMPEEMTLAEENGNYVMVLRYERSTTPAPVDPICLYQFVYHYTHYDADGNVISDNSVTDGPYIGKIGGVASTVPADHTVYNGTTYTYQNGTASINLTEEGKTYTLDLYYVLRDTPATTEPPVTTTEPPVTETEPPETSAPETTEPETTTEPTEPVDPPKPDVPDTSDANNIPLFAALAVLSAMGLIVLAFRGKKKSK